MGDSRYVMRLIVARDVYHCHFNELSPKQMEYVEELLALAILEKEASSDKTPTPSDDLSDIAQPKRT